MHNSVDTTSEKHKFKDFHYLFAVAFIALLTLLAYSSVFSAGFIWDDDAYVLNNPCLHSLSGLYEIWFEPGATPQYYPMVFTVFWVQSHLWGMHPFGYHLVNILLHIANALLLWACLKRLKVPTAVWIAALFAVHPVQVESVAWITELKNVLSLFFSLLSLLAYLRYAETDKKATPALQRRIYYAASLLLFLLSLFSKTVCGSLPAVILLIRWWHSGRINRREVLNLVPFFTFAVILGRQTAWMELHHVMAEGPEWDFSFAERTLIAGRAVWFYIGKFLWPHPLIFNYYRWDIDSSRLFYYLSPLALVILLLILWLLRGRIGRGPLAGMLFFVGTVFPALGFFNVYPMRYSFVADHFIYVPVIGLIVLFSVSIHKLQHTLLPTAGNMAGSLAVLFLIVGCSILTWRQGRLYHDNVTLFSDTIAKNPSGWFAYANRGKAYSALGETDLATEDIARSLELKIVNADAIQSRGRQFLDSRDFGKAMKSFNLAIALCPWRADYYMSRSIAFKISGRTDMALADADKVVSINSADAESYLYRASINALREDYPHALQDLNEAIRIDTSGFEAYANRGLVYYRQGMLSAACKDFDMALRLKPDSAETYFNRGLAYVAAEKPVKARADFDTARQLGYQLTDMQEHSLLRDNVK